MFRVVVHFVLVLHLKICQRDVACFVLVQLDILHWLLLGRKHLLFLLLLDLDLLDQVVQKRSAVFFNNGVWHFLLPVVKETALTQLDIKFLVLLLDNVELFLGVFLDLVSVLFHQRALVGLMEILGVLGVEQNRVLGVELVLRVVLHYGRVHATVLVVAQHQLALVHCHLLSHELRVVVVQVVVFHQVVPVHALVGVVL